MATTNLNLPEITESQASKYVTHNNALAILDRVIAGIATRNIATDADYTLTGDELDSVVINITDTGTVLTGGINIICADGPLLFVAINSTLQTLTFKTSAGTGVTLAPTDSIHLRSDGTNVVKVQAKNIQLGSAQYDFTTSGGAIGAIDLLGDSLPDNSTITRAFYEVLTAFTSGGAATVAFGVTTDDASGLLAATAYNNAVFNAGYHDFIPDNTAANFTTKTTAARSLILTVATAALTAGRVRIWFEYITSE